MNLSLLNDQNYYAIINALEEGVIVLDKHHTIILANTSACRIINLTTQDCIGHIPSQLNLDINTLEGDPFPESDWPYHKIKKNSDISRNLEISITNSEGIPSILNINTYPIIIKSKIQGNVMTITDITRSKLDHWKQFQFMKIIGHELKHPLSCIQAYAYSLRKATQKVSGRADSYVDKLENQIEVMTDMLNTLLDTTKLVTQTLTIQTQPHNLTNHHLRSRTPPSQTHPHAQNSSQYYGSHRSDQISPGHHQSHLQCCQILTRKPNYKYHTHSKR